MATFGLIEIFGFFFTNFPILADASPSLSAFTKMDAAMKNNMMRALINLRRYRRAASDEAGSDFQ